jgi:hypothetical protein
MDESLGKQWVDIALYQVQDLVTCDLPVMDQAGDESALF